MKHFTAPDNPAFTKRMWRNLIGIFAFGLLVAVGIIVTFYIVFIDPAKMNHL